MAVFKLLWKTRHYKNLWSLSQKIANDTRGTVMETGIVFCRKVGTESWKVWVVKVTDITDPGKDMGPFHYLYNYSDCLRGTIIVKGVFYFSPRDLVELHVRI